VFFLDLSSYAGFSCVRLPLLNKPKAVAVALSGGPDSMALCAVLSLWARKNKVTLHALTVDHGLRAESKVEAKQVAGWVKTMRGVTHKILSAKKMLQGKDSKIMESARAARYELMSAYCRKHKIDYLFLAHHQDDQAETFLFRLAKGSGLDGLTAMKQCAAYDYSLTLVRPFLDIPKSDLVAYCEDHGVPFVTDPTNRNPDYARNRIRAAHDVLAAEGLNAKRLSITALRLARARDALDYYAERAYMAALKEKTRERIVLDLNVMQDQPLETGLRVIRKAVDHLVPGDGYGPRTERLEGLVADLLGPATPFRKRTLGGCIFSIHYKRGEIIVENET